MKAARRLQQGFTLIEVLVALVLLALVSLISWRGLDAVHNVGERLDARAEDSLSLVRTLAQIERDILLHAGPNVLPGLAAVASDTRPGARPATHQAMPPGIVWSPATGLGLVRAAGNGTWQQLRWYLQDGRLFRTVGAPSYRLPLPQAGTGAAVLDGVLGFTVRVWGPGQGWVEPGSGSDTVAVRPATSEPVTGIEIAIYRQGVGDDRPYRKVVILP
ncbi:type II secretion system protein J [Allopusillimonas ginsengisoli]|uniref:PulJ/GspJ family protein n=1 Tax=Allopusillimonas ginsengisoli TaxID=453575 RepID=UPI0010C21804|nr:prepilin-type N-terminal cleavage/methylation domain-containing protein [Allopusillimonas ginsengisoli]